MTAAVEHDYNAYARGCRCSVCRQAKADYMRCRRAEARALAQQHCSRLPGASRQRGIVPGSVRYVADIASHGTRYGYEEAGCRCFACTAARTASDKALKQRRVAL